jgi:hypothetical protein
MGNGDCELLIHPNPQSPIHNHQSTIHNPHVIKFKINIHLKNIFTALKLFNNKKIKIDILIKWESK